MAIASVAANEVQTFYQDLLGQVYHLSYQGTRIRSVRDGSGKMKLAAFAGIDPTVFSTDKFVGTTLVMSKGGLPTSSELYG